MWRSTAENQLQSAGRELDVTTRLGVIKLHRKVTGAVHHYIVYFTIWDEKKMVHLSPVAHFITRLDYSGIMCVYTESHRLYVANITADTETRLLM